MTDEQIMSPNDDENNTSADDWRTAWKQLVREMTQSENEETRLSHRAQMYAEPMARGGDLSDSESYQVLCFLLGEEKYALDVMLVRSVRMTGTITRVPGLPSFFPGVINVRGQMITVFDLRHWYGNPAPDNPPEVIVIEANHLHLAVLADRIETVIRIAHTRVTPLDLRYARGVTTDRRVMLDMVALCADDRLQIGNRENF